MRKVSTKYTVLTFRQKVSFHAAKESKTIMEHFIDTVISTYEALLSKQVIEIPEAQINE